MKTQLVCIEIQLCLMKSNSIVMKSQPDVDENLAMCCCKPSHFFDGNLTRTAYEFVANCYEHLTMDVWKCNDVNEKTANAYDSLNHIFL